MMQNLIDRRHAAKYANVAMPTMFRWMTKGVLDAHGNRVCVNTVRRGGRLYTTKQWIDEFFDVLSAAHRAYHGRFRQTKAERREQIERARAGCKARG